jgi:hypothetical protein
MCIRHQARSIFLVYKELWPFLFERCKKFRRRRRKVTVLDLPSVCSIADNLPPSVVVTGGYDTLCNCRLWYEIRAYVMHAEHHATLERKHLRTSVKFQVWFRFIMLRLRLLLVWTSSNPLSCNSSLYVAITATM